MAAPEGQANGGGRSAPAVVRLNRSMATLDVGLMGSLFAGTVVQATGGAVSREEAQMLAQAAKP